MSAIREWAQITTGILGQAEQIYDGLAKPLRLWEHNDLESLVVATPAGELVGDGPLTREEVAARSAIFQSLSAWLVTPIVIGQDVEGADVAMSPIELLSRRSL